MAAETSEPCGECEWQVRGCDRLLAGFHTGRITLDEYDVTAAFRVEATDHELANQ
jgi:hypothetical protein